MGACSLQGDKQEYQRAMELIKKAKSEVWGEYDADGD